MLMAVADLRAEHVQWPQLPTVVRTRAVARRLPERPVVMTRMSLGAVDSGHAGSMNLEGPLVVALSGTSGAGKSTLAHGLAARLREGGIHVETLHFDDFTNESDLPEGDAQAWVARGAVPDEWTTLSLERCLVDLLGGEKGQRDQQSALVILIEEPFGRSRTAIGRMVDCSIHLRLPLHVALARRLLRQYVPGSGGLDEKAAAELRSYLSRYLRLGADFYQAVEAAAAASADVVLDASNSPDHLVDAALSAILHARK
jgi:uridine kinase